MSGQAAAPAIIAILFPVFFVGLWLLVTSLLGRMSGWTSLQDVYPDRWEEPLDRFRFQSASMGGFLGMPVNFSGCLTIDACATGLRFRVWKIFGLFLKPFFVPWADISVEEKKVFLMNVACVQFSRWPGGRMYFAKGRWNRLVSKAPSPSFAVGS